MSAACECEHDVGATLPPMLVVVDEVARGLEGGPRWAWKKMRLSGRLLSGWLWSGCPAA